MYAHRGVTLTSSEVPRLIALDEEYAIAGRVTTGDPFVQIALKTNTVERFVVTCLPVGTGGEFAADIVWNSATFGGELAWLMVSAAPTDCISHHGWSRSVVLGIHHA